MPVEICQATFGVKAGTFNQDTMQHIFKVVKKGYVLNFPNETVLSPKLMRAGENL